MEIQIELLHNYKRDNYKNLYIFEFKITTLKKTWFNPKDILCDSGKYVDVDLQDMPKLVNTNLMKGDYVTGFTFYEKNYIGTLRPNMRYKDYEFKIDKKYEKWGE